jgi:hypothetical protein
VENVFIELAVALILSLVGNLVFYFWLVHSNWKAIRLQSQVERLTCEKRELHHALLTSQASRISSPLLQEIKH